MIREYEIAMLCCIEGSNIIADNHTEENRFSGGLDATWCQSFVGCDCNTYHTTLDAQFEAPLHALLPDPSNFLISLCCSSYLLSMVFIFAVSSLLVTFSA